jgi:hypothetical protein
MHCHTRGGSAFFALGTLEHRRSSGIISAWLPEIGDPWGFPGQLTLVSSCWGSRRQGEEESLRAMWVRRIRCRPAARRTRSEGASGKRVDSLAAEATNSCQVSVSQHQRPLRARCAGNSLLAKKNHRLAALLHLPRTSHPRQRRRATSRPPQRSRQWPTVSRSGPSREF